MCGRKISPSVVGRALRDARVSYVIVGAHASNGYSGRPRATADVDVIVRSVKRAESAIATRYPKLSVRREFGMIRFIDGTLEAVDLITTSQRPLCRRLLKENRSVRVGSERVRIPRLEGVLAMKFEAMRLSERRLHDKYQDACDFARVVEANEAIDLDALGHLGDLVCARGGVKVTNLVEDVRAGRRMEI